MGPLLVALAVALDILQAGVTAALLTIPGIGIVLAIGVNIAISLTLGSGHTFGLYVHIHERASRLKIKIEAFFLRRLLLFFFGKTLPILNSLPLFTVSTFLAFHALRKEEREQLQKAAANNNEPQDETALVLQRRKLAAEAYTAYMALREQQAANDEIDAQSTGPNNKKEA